MSDLQCAARVYVARHGEAAYESELLSDAGGSLTARGRRQARDLGLGLRDQRIAEVWCSSMSRAVQTAEIAAGVLGCDVTVRDSLREFGVGVHAGSPEEPDPFEATFRRWLAGDLGARIEGAESGAEVAARFQGVLDEVADQHRGEAVLVVSHGGAICVGVCAAVRNLTLDHPEDHPVPNCGVVEVEIDADGWVARSWCGEQLT